MLSKDKIKKLEKMFPPPVRIEHRPGSCFMEQTIDHMRGGIRTMVAECERADCWAKGDGKKWVKNEHCEQYENDCKRCQIERGLNFRQRYIVRDGDDVEENRDDVRKIFQSGGENERKTKDQ